MPYDVVTLGETMLRLSPPGYERIEQAKQFEVFLAGTESNTAVGLVRLGLHVLWISRLPDSPMGRIVAGSLAQFGVDVSQVIWADDERMGLNFVERGKPPRPTRVIYDRAESAFSHIQPDDLPDDVFQPQNATLLHLTGITPALSQSCMDTAQYALQRAKDAGWQVTFDINYRAKLWTADEAAISCEPFLMNADVIFAPLGDMQTIYGQETVEDALAFLAERYPKAIIVVTAGKAGTYTIEPNGVHHHHPIFPAEEVDRVGGGDAFSAGFLYAYRRFPDDEHRIPQALRWGAAAAAVKYTIPGDMPILNHDEVAALVGGEGYTSVKR